MRRNRLVHQSSKFHVAVRTVCAAILLGSVSLAWGRPPQGGPLGADLSLPVPGVTDYPQNSRLPHSSSELPTADRPGIVATLQFKDPRALGEFMLRCYDAGLRVELIHMSAPATASGVRVGHAVVRSPQASLQDRVRELGQLLEFRIPGLELSVMRFRPLDGLPVASPPQNPLSNRVDQMQKDLANLKQQIARLEALRAEFRGQTVHFSEPIDGPIGLPPVDFSNLHDPRTGNPRTPGPVLYDPPSKTPGTLDLLLIDPPSKTPGTLDLLLIDPATGNPRTPGPVLYDPPTGTPRPSGSPS